MGSSQSSAKCKGKTGADFVACAFGGGDINKAKEFLINASPPGFGTGVYNFFVDCNNGSIDPDVGLICVDDGTIDDDIKQKFLFSVEADNFGEKVPNTSSAHPNTMVGARTYNSIIMGWFAVTYNRIDDLWPGHADDWWVRMYHFYNTPHGRDLVEDYIKTANPPANVQAILRANYTDHNQRLYGLLNAPDFSTRAKGAGILPNNYSVDYEHPNDTQFLRVPFNQTDFANTRGRTAVENTWGNPLWTHEKRQEIWRQILGMDKNANGPTDGKAFIDEWAQAFINDGFANPGKTAEDYFDPLKHAGAYNPWDDPDYSGLLPKLAHYAVGNEPWHQSTLDPNSYGYKDPCLETPFLDEVVPILGGVVGAGFGAIFIPGSTARIMGAGTGGGTAYYLVSSVFGLKSVEAIFSGDKSNDNNAATILSVGAPMTLVQVPWDLDLIPAKYATRNIHIASIAAAAGLGYFVLLPIVEPVLDISGSLVSILTAPISLLESAATYIGNGCVAHTWNSVAQCLCEDANQKPRLVKALAGPVYGCTDNQEKLRSQCAQARMQTGSWGDDPVSMGTCDDKGHMSNPFACISAGEWAYGQFVPDIAEDAKKRWAEISPCFDASNPSFLPPRKGVDEPCAVHGKYFRMVDGNCIDQRAPEGKQGPGEFDWAKSAAITAKGEQKLAEGDCTIL